MRDNYKTLRINYVDDKYWYQPSIVTLSRTAWSVKVFKKFDDLLEKTQNLDRIIFVNLNGDPNFVRFNEIQKCHNTTLRLNVNYFKAQKDYSVFLTDDICMYFPAKGVKAIQQGKQFSAPTLMLERLCYKFKKDLEEDEIYLITYTKFNFEISIVKRSDYQ